jgi:hypothetical protein
VSFSEFIRLQFRLHGIFLNPGWATSTTPHSTTLDPAETEALNCLDQGTQQLEEGDIEAAKRLYKRSTEIKRTAGALFNLGVTHYHLSMSFIKKPITTARLNYLRGI